MLHPAQVLVEITGGSYFSDCLNNVPTLIINGYRTSINSYINKETIIWRQILEIQVHTLLSLCLLLVLLIANSAPAGTTCIHCQKYNYMVKCILFPSDINHIKIVCLIRLFRFGSHSVGHAECSLIFIRQDPTFSVILPSKVHC